MESEKLVSADSLREWLKKIPLHDLSDAKRIEVPTMYESPIKVFQSNLEMQFEGEILKAVQRTAIDVDRDELIRALRYDREQYQKGFDDARKNAVPVVRCEDCKYGDYDSKPNGAMVCLRTKDGFWWKETDFCSYGERMEE